jgi:hypothetical protein
MQANNKLVILQQWRYNTCTYTKETKMKNAATTLYYFPKLWEECKSGQEPCKPIPYCIDCRHNETCVQLFAYNGDVVAQKVIAAFAAVQ